MKKTIQLITSIGCLALGISSLHAASGNWVSPAVSGSWSVSANWVSGIIADGSTFTATFPSLGPTPTTITLDTSRTIGNVAFTPNGKIYNLSGGTTLTFDGASPSLLRAVSGGTLNVGVVLAGGSAGIRTPNQTGTVVLNTNNTFTGDLQIHRGTIKYGVTNAIPSGPGYGNVVMVINTGFGGNGEPALLDLNNFDATINGLNSLDTGGAVFNFPVVKVTGATAGMSTLTVGGNDADGSFNGTIIDGATRTMALTKIGNGTQSLTNDSTYSGATTVNAGTLLVNGTIGGGSTASAVTVNGGTFGGIGTCYGPVTVGAGGNIGAGNNGPGTLTVFGALDLSSGGTNIWELAANSDSNPGTDFDVINLPVAPALDVTDATLRIRFIGSATTPNGVGFWASSHTWNIITAAGGSGVSKFKTIVVEGAAPAGTFTNANSGTAIVLYFTPGPVPVVALRSKITSITGAGTASVTVNYTNTVPTKTYFLRYKTNMNGGWTTNLPGKIAVGTSDFQIDTPVIGSQRYYQVYYVAP